MNNSDFISDFDNAFSSKKKTEFETWFTRMAEQVWGTNFDVIKAGGTHGDKKSDGYHIPSNRIFQCYAPESPNTFAANAPAKVKDSFPEVTTYWPELQEWVFIHNNSDGITTTLSDTFEQLRKEYPKIKISQGSRNLVKNMLHDKLSVQQLIDLYPEASALVRIRVEMRHIRPLLRSIISNATATPDPSDFGLIPDEDKLDSNDLSPYAISDLRRALDQAGLVAAYLKGASKPLVNETLQAEMRSKYQELKAFGHTSDEIIQKMLTFAGDDGTPEVRSAAYVIVAYYFDSCDIFENSIDASV